MKHPDTENDQKSGKPYDIRERSMLFACEVVRIAQELHHRGRIAGELSIQLVNAAVNAASNLDEADDGSSRPAIEESTELVKIVATIIRNSERNEAQRALTKKKL